MERAGKNCLVQELGPLPAESTWRRDWKSTENWHMRSGEVQESETELHDFGTDILKLLDAIFQGKNDASLPFLLQNYRKIVHLQISAERGLEKTESGVI